MQLVMDNWTTSTKVSSSRRGGHSREAKATRKGDRKGIVCKERREV